MTVLRVIIFWTLKASLLCAAFGGFFGSLAALVEEPGCTLGMQALLILKAGVYGTVPGAIIGVFLGIFFGILSALFLEQSKKD